MLKKHRPKNVQKSTEKRTKNGPRGLPGASLRPPWAWSRHFLRKEWKLIKIWTAFYWSRGRPGDPVGTPKSTKNELGNEKGRPETAPEALFVGFSCRCHLESLSGPILARFFTENRAWIERVFSRKHLKFLDGATSRIVCNLHTETHFFIFFKFYIFYRENDEKRCKAASGKKSRKKYKKMMKKAKLSSRDQVGC